MFLDDRATPEQAEKLGALFSRQLGGPPASPGPLIGEFLGAERGKERIHHAVLVGRVTR